MISANVKAGPVWQNAANVIQFSLADNGTYLDAATLTSAELQVCMSCTSTVYSLSDLLVVADGPDNVLQLDITPTLHGKMKLYLKVNGFGVNLSKSSINVIKGGC